MKVSFIQPRTELQPYIESFWVFESVVGMPQTISLEEKAVLVILVLIGRFFLHGQRLMDRLDYVLIVGLDKTTQDLAGFLAWPAALQPIHR